MASGFRELVFACTTEGADEIGGKIFEWRAGGDASLGHSNGGVVLPATEVANHFLHKRLILIKFKV